MKKIELIQELSEKTGLSKKDSEKVLGAFIEIIEGAMAKEDEVVLTGFGKFYVKDRPARTGRNPQTGEEMQIPAKKVVAFKVGKKLQEIVE